MAEAERTNQLLAPNNKELIIQLGKISNLTKMYEALQLKLLNTTHPFLKEVIGFCEVLLTWAKDDEDPKMESCHILSECLVKLTEANKDNEEVTEALMKCISLL